MSYLSKILALAVIVQTSIFIHCYSYGIEKEGTSKTTKTFDLQSKEELYQQAREYYRRGEWHNALEILSHLKETSLSRDHENRMDLLRGMCYLKLNEYSRAFSLIKKKKQFFPIIEDHVTFTLAEILFFQREYKKAIEQYSEILTHFEYSSLSPQAYTRIIECKIELGKFESALTYIQRGESRLHHRVFSRINPHFLSILKARVYEKKEDYTTEARILSYVKFNPAAAEFHNTARERLTKLKNHGIEYQPHYGEKLRDYIVMMQKIWAHREIVNIVDRVRSEITIDHPNFSRYTDQWFIYI